MCNRCKFSHGARYPGRLCVALLSILSAACVDRGGSQRFEITNRFPHDPDAYTQGLLWADSTLFESTGRYGHSDVRKVDLQSGRILASRPLPSNRFGEGLALLNGRLYQLTWQSGIAYTYDPRTLTLIDSIPYVGEGWGLTTDGTSLIMSDGSDSLRYVDPATFKAKRVVHVRYNDAPLLEVNELEYVNGEILANVYHTNWIVRIDPANGVVSEAIDLANLFPNRPVLADVMNGIALAPDGQHLLVTGKLWPTLFEIRLH